MLRRFVTEKSIFVGLLTISVALNLLLSLEVYRKRELVHLLKENRKLTLGEVVSPLIGTDTKGDQVTIDLGSRAIPTVLYYSSSTCYWCSVNSANLEALAQQAEGRYNLMFLSAEKSLEADISALSGTKTSILFDPAIESKLALDLTSTPTTLLVSAKGEVRKIWRGAYGGERRVDIEETLGIKLPGVPDEKVRPEVAAKLPTVQ